MPSSKRRSSKPQRLNVRICSISNFKIPNHTDNGKYLALAVAVSSSKEDPSSPRKKREIIYWNNRVVLDKSGSCLGLDHSNGNFLFEQCVNDNIDDSEDALVIDVVILRKIPKLDIEEVCCSCRIHYNRDNASRECGYKLIENDDQSAGSFVYPNGISHDVNSNCSTKSHTVGDIRVYYEFVNTSLVKNKFGLSKAIILLLVLIIIPVMALAWVAVFLGDFEKYQRLLQVLPTQSEEVKSMLLHTKDSIGRIFDKLEKVTLTDTGVIPQTPLIMARIDMGLDLLAKGDQSGAEAACSLATRLDPNNSKARICSGEARLSLYVQALSIGSSHIYKDKLDMAVEEFQMLVDDDPSNPAARSGLGLSYLLKGLSMEVPSNERSRYMFEASLHFSAASNQYNEKEGHLPSLWNSAITQIYLERSDIACNLFRKVLQHERNALILSNVGVAFLSIGDFEGASNILREASDLSCAMTERNNSQLDLSHVCSNIYNSLGVALELVTKPCHHEKKTCKQLALESYESALQWNSLNDKAKENHAKLLSVLVDDSQYDVESAFDGTNGTNEDVLNNLKLAISTYERALEQAPSSSRLWMGLSRAKAHGGDEQGALNAAAKAVESAIGKDELNMATKLLEDALDRTISIDDHNMEKKPSSFANQDENISLDVKSLRNELELQKSTIQSLQVLLQESAKVSERKMEEAEIIESVNHVSETITQVESNNNTIKNQSNVTEANDFERVEEYQARKDLANHNVTKSFNEGVINSNNKFDENEKIRLISEDTLSSVPVFDIKPEKSTDTKPLETDTLNSKAANVSNKEESFPTSATQTIKGNPEEGEKKFIQYSVKNDPDPEVIDLDNVESSIVGYKRPKDDSVIVPAELTEGTSNSDHLILFEPQVNAAQEVPVVSESYMKLAEAHISQGSFTKAATQYRRVLDKTPDYLPALEGLAKSLENTKSVKVNDIAEAYNKAARAAVIVGEVDRAEEYLRKAMEMALTVNEDSIVILKKLLAHAHTPQVAADILYQIGLQYELIKDDEHSIQEAISSFERANKIIKKYSISDKEVVHGDSLLNLGKIALENNDTSKAESYFTEALKDEWKDGGLQINFLLGQVQEAEGNFDEAIDTYNNVLESAGLTLTGEVHHRIAVMFSKKHNDIHAEEVVYHFEKALESGMDPTEEAIRSLGEDNDYVKIARLIKERSMKQTENEGPSVSSRSSINLKTKNKLSL